jgi:two-component system chemotaxis response regulator CheB
MEKNQLNSLEKVVVIGGSAGSLEVILELLPTLQNIDSIAIILIMHRRNSDDTVLEELLRMKSGLRVREIEDKTPMKPGRVYVAPADYHLFIETDLSFSLDVSEKVHYSRPSIDVGFESAAAIFGDQLVAILLSGANSDGTEGLLAVKKMGGLTIVQSPETAEVAFMPTFALNHASPDHVLSPKEIAQFIRDLVHP